MWMFIWLFSEFLHVDMGLWWVLSGFYGVVTV